MPKLLRSGSGSHRLDSCGHFNSRHLLAKRRSDFFRLDKLLSSPPSVIDALDTLYTLCTFFVSALFFTTMFEAVKPALILTSYSHH